MPMPYTLTRGPLLTLLENALNPKSAQAGRRSATASWPPCGWHALVPDPLGHLRTGGRASRSPATDWTSGSRRTGSATRRSPGGTPRATGSVTKATSRASFAKD